MATSSPVRPRRTRRLSRAVALALVLLAFLGPIMLMIVAALRRNQDIFRYGGALSWRTFLPSPATFDNLLAAAQLPGFITQLGNTVVLGIVQSTLTVILSVLAAFPLARMRFRGRGVVFYAVLATMFVPFEALVVPLFLIVRDQGLLDSFWGLLLPWVASPVGVFLLRQAMAEIPRELEEAIIIDGGGLWHILRHAVIPNITSAAVTVWIVTFVYIWDSFLWPLVIVQSPDKQLVQVGISALFNPSKIEYGTVFAASVLAATPVIVVFVLLQRYYVRSVATSGIK